VYVFLVLIPPQKPSLTGGPPRQPPTPHSLYPFRIFSVRLPRMRNLTATLCLTLAVLLGSAGTSWGADKSAGDKVFEEFVTQLLLVRILDRLKIFHGIKLKDGSTRRRSSEKHYKPMSAGKLDSMIAPGFKKAGIETVLYSDVADECDGPDKSKIRDLFAAKGELPGLIRRAAFKAIRKCESKYSLIVTLTLDGLSEREKGRVLYKGEAKVYDVSKRIPRTISIALFEGHSAGANVMDVREAVFEIVAAKLVGGKVTGSNKVYKGKLLQKVRIILEAKQPAIAEAKRKAAEIARIDRAIAQSEKRLAEEAKRKAAEAKRKAAEAKRKAAEAKRKAKRKAAEAKRKAAEEAKKKRKRIAAEDAKVKTARGKWGIKFGMRINQVAKFSPNCRETAPRKKVITLECKKLILGKDRSISLNGNDTGSFWGRIFLMPGNSRVKSIGVNLSVSTREMRKKLHRILSKKYKVNHLITPLERQEYNEEGSSRRVLRNIYDNGRIVVSITRSCSKYYGQWGSRKCLTYSNYLKLIYNNDKLAATTMKKIRRSKMGEDL